jgi:hypothetical protein
MNPVRKGGRLVAALMALLCSGCHQSGSPGKGTPTFEIREVACQEQIGPDLNGGASYWSHECHATLLTRDPRYQTGEIIVWYEDVTKGRDGKQIHTEPTPGTALMSDGVATITGGAYYARKSEYLPSGVDSDPGAPQPEWKILGFAPLDPVRVETQE